MLNKCLETYFRYYASTKPKSWNRWLALVEWWYNTTFHTATKMSPFGALYGYAPPQLLSNVPRSSNNEAVDPNLRTRDHIKSILKENLVSTLNRMKLYVEKRRVYRQFEVGD